MSPLWPLTVGGLESMVDRGIIDGFSSVWQDFQPASYPTCLGAVASSASHPCIKEPYHPLELHSFHISIDFIHIKHPHILQSKASLPNQLHHQTKLKILNPKNAKWLPDLSSRCWLATGKSPCFVSGNQHSQILIVLSKFSETYTAPPPLLEMIKGMRATGAGVVVLSCSDPRLNPYQVLGIDGKTVSKSTIPVPDNFRYLAWSYSPQNAS
jgi:hypothetical protein